MRDQFYRFIVPFSLFPPLLSFPILEMVYSFPSLLDTSFIEKVVFFRLINQPYCTLQTITFFKHWLPAILQTKTLQESFFPLAQSQIDRFHLDGPDFHFGSIVFFYTSHLFTSTITVHSRLAPCCCHTSSALPQLCRDRSP